MKRHRFLFAVGAFLSLPLFVGCNLYSSFASPNNDEEYIQEAHKCLREGDYECAISSYSKIASTELKNEKLCLVQLTRGGLGISELVNTIASSGGVSMLGRLARALMPWNEEKETALEAAVEECNKLQTITDTQKQALLRILAYLSECALKIAKTDRWVSTSDGSPTACNSASDGNRDGQLTDVDIASNPAAALSPSNPGMCEADVRTCLTNLDTADTLSASLGGDLVSVSGNLNDVPTDLKDTGTTATAARTAIANTIN